LDLASFFSLKGHHFAAAIFEQVFEAPLLLGKNGGSIRKRYSNEHSTLGQKLPSPWVSRSWCKSRKSNYGNSLHIFMVTPRRAGINGKGRRLSPYIFLPLKLTPCRNLLAMNLNWMPSRISSVLKYSTSRIHTLAYHESECSRIWSSVGIEYSTAPRCLFEYVYSQHHIRQQHKVLAPASTPEKNSAYSERHLIPFPLITAIILRSVRLRKYSLSPFLTNDQVRHREHLFPETSYSITQATSPRFYPLQAA